MASLFALQGRSLRPASLVSGPPHSFRQPSRRVAQRTVDHPGLGRQVLWSPGNGPQVATHAASPDFIAPVSATVSPESAGAIRTLGFLAFWTQLPLTVVSAGILFFSVTFSHTSGASDPTKWFTLVGVVLAFISTFFADGFRRIARKVSSGEAVAKASVVGNILRNNTINLLGIGVTLVGLQASIGALVGKTLLSSSNPYAAAQQGAGGALVSLDVFSLQASANTIMAHFLSLVFTNLLLKASEIGAGKQAAA